MRLTQRQEAFSLFLFEDMPQREAYLKAGYSSKMLPATIDHNASVLASNSKVVTRIQQLRQRAEDASVATVLERKQVLTEIVRGRFADFMTKLTPEKLKSAALQEIRITEDAEGKKTTTIKLHSPIEAIKEQNKMERIGNDQMPTGQDNRQVNIFVLNEETKNLLGNLAGWTQRPTVTAEDAQQKKG